MLNGILQLEKSGDSNSPALHVAVKDKIFPVAVSSHEESVAVKSLVGKCVEFEPRTFLTTEGNVVFAVHVSPAASDSVN